MFEHYTEQARQTVILAGVEARSLQQNHIGSDHILLALLHEGEDVAGKVLESHGITLDTAHQQSVALRRCGDCPDRESATAPQ